MTDRPDGDLVPNPIADNGRPLVSREAAEQLRLMQPAFERGRGLLVAMACGDPTAIDAVMLDVADSGTTVDVLSAVATDFLLTVVDGLNGDKDLSLKWFKARLQAQLDRSDQPPPAAGQTAP